MKPLEPETTVAWEGDRASGTVELELTPQLLATDPPPDDEPATPPPAQKPARGFLARLLRRRPEPVAAEARCPTPADPSPPALGPEPPPPAADPAPTAPAAVAAAAPSD